MQNFFRHSDFREILNELVRAQKEKTPDFNFSKLSRVIGVQKTFLSKVMSGGSQLSADQVYLLADFFELTKEEHDYFMLLIECERTGLAKRRQALEKKIGALQAAHRNTKQSLKAKSSDESISDSRAEYYLDPFMTIAHLFLTLPAYAGDAKKVAQKLRLTDAHASKIFLGLERMGLIQRLSKDGFYRVIEDHIHLTSDSLLITPYHALFRMASLQELMRAAPDERFAFSVTFSADEKTKKLVHEAFLKFLREIEPAVKAAPSEEVYQLNFDLFSWS
jgi:uncharacterized protein (TIGR02147 family)